MIVIGSKDSRLIAAVSHLEAALGEGSLIPEDYWEADMLAVGLANPQCPGVLAYVAVCEPDGYFVSIERPPATGSSLPYQTTESFKCSNLDDVCWVVRDFLYIA
jgi:hypothetical protein